MSLYQDMRRLERARHRRERAEQRRWLAAYEPPPREPDAAVTVSTVAAGIRKRPAFSDVPSQPSRR